MPNLEAWAPRVLSLLRIVAALLFMEHGLITFPRRSRARPTRCR